jgi:DNA-binding NarL/FixJ family response regulator
VAEPIRVVLVEDNDTFRETLELLCGLRPELEVVASLASGSRAPELAAALQPDVVVMDYRMPGVDGAQATRAVLAAAPGVRVVCLTASVTAQEVEQLREAGAAACLTKDEDFDQIVAAVIGAGTRDVE